MITQIQKWVDKEKTQTYTIHDNRVSVSNEFGFFTISITPQNDGSISKSLTKVVKNLKSIESIEYFANKDFFKIS